MDAIVSQTRLRLALIASLICPSHAAGAQVLGVERLASGLERPVHACAPPGDLQRIFVLEATAGRVRIIRDGTLLPTPFLDIGSQVNDWLEGGLTSLAFHPDYDSNGRFFVAYVDTNEDTVVAEHLVSSNPDLAEAAVVQELLRVHQPNPIHNGGYLRFAPDGKLIVGMGDGGPGGDPQNRAQDPSQIFGKLLRLDVDRPPPFVPPDNPFVGTPGADERVWVLGLRNPWGLGFDSVTGELYIGDVGQASLEEVDVLPGTSVGGENFGWRCSEGTSCYTPSCCGDLGHTPPIHEYAHSGGRCALIGGPLYRGSALPALAGSYFFGDLCSTEIFTLRYANGVVSELRDRTLELEPAGAPTIQILYAFGVDGAGEVLLLDANGGEVFRVVPGCGSASYCVGAPNSVGSGAVLSSSGSTSISAADLTLIAEQAPASMPGLFFYGGARSASPFGGGTLCVGAGGFGLFRLNPPSSTDASGRIERAVDYSGPPMSFPPGEVLAGSTWYFQFWYRDPHGPVATSNLSQGLAISFCP